jgi:hypothetical protein
MPAILHHSVPDRPDRRGTRASSPGRSHRCGWVMSGPFEPGCNWNAVPATWPCSISPSTASCVAAATLSRSASMMWLPNGYAVDRATVRQRKTGRPVRFELTEVTRQAVDDYLRESGLMSGQCLFPGHFGPDRPLTTRQYARLVSHPCLGTVGHGTLSPLRGVGRAWQLCSGISDSLGAAQPNWLVSQERGGQPWMNAAPHRDS